MSTLNHPVDHDDTASQWTSKLFQYFIAGVTKNGVKGFDVGRSHYEFNHQGKTITIKITAK